MKILFDIGHPGHVHLFKNLIKELKTKGHSVFVTVKDIPIAKQLLKAYEIDFIELGNKKDSLIGKLFFQFKYNFSVALIVLKNKIELGIGSSITIAQVSKISSMKSIILDDDDDEVEPLFVKYVHPFANMILSPDANGMKRKNKKTLYYSGYHELAYLHPKRFKPDPEVLNELKLKENDAFFIMRFNVFKAHHDLNAQGLSLQQKLKLIDTLKPHGKIFITTEREIEPELKEYQLSISPEKAHSLLAYSTIFLGDSQTMTSEACVLGVPALRCNSFAGKISYLEEEEHKYELTFAFKPNDFDKMLFKLQQLLQEKDLQLKWKLKKEKMLQDKIDVTAFLSWFVENYPESVSTMKNDPSYQLNFK